MSAAANRRRAARILNAEDAREAARRRLPRSVFRYFEGGTDDRLTVAANQRAFREVAFRPHVGRDVSTIDTSRTVLGSRLSFPIVPAPAGYIRLAHRDGERAVARAAGAAGTAVGLSTLSSWALEDVVAAGTAPVWFQLYLVGGRDSAESAMERARDSGCSVLVVTVDLAAAASPDRPLRGGRIPTRVGVGEAFRYAPEMLRRPAWLAGFLRDGLELDVPNVRDPGGRTLSVGEASARMARSPGVTWEDLAWIRGRWAGRLVVKGVLRADDAGRAADLGADAVVVSNHGGNALDGAVASLHALPEVVAAVPAHVEVLLDGGIRRGSDAVKALILGARAVLVGRPYIWGLAAAGEPGVARVLDLLHDGVRRTLAMLGCAGLDDLEPSLLAYSENR